MGDQNFRNLEQVNARNGLHQMDFLMIGIHPTLLQPLVTVH